MPELSDPAGATMPAGSPVHGPVNMLVEGFGLHQPLRPTQMQTFLTPEPDLFSVWHLGIPDLNPIDWTLTITGLVDSPLSLGMSELLAMPQTSVTAVHECAGSPLHPRIPQRRVGNVTWTGVPVAHLLAQAGARNDARFLVSTGYDHGTYDGQHHPRYEKDLPLQEALTGDALIALAIDGEPLNARRGGPARLVVPGWYGTNSVKWLQALQLTTERSASAFTTRYYMDPPPADDPGPPTPVWAIAPNSVLVAPADGTVHAGNTVTVWGWAWAADPITAVDVSLDDGETWTRADLEPRVQRSWQRFHLPWTPASVGEHTLITRAATSSLVQPTHRCRNQVYRRQVFVTLAADVHATPPLEPETTTP